uniref:Exonuclease VIII n=1 Tax=Pseudomonas phage Touem01 TaxID=3138548 RepID=A0AAU6W2P2_9VIRU
MSEDHPLGLVEQTNEQYHAGPGISKSKLDAIAISGLNYWDQYVNPNREPREEKHCFAVGDGTHKIILEPGTFEHTYAVGFDRSAHPDALDSADDMKQVLAKEMLVTSGTKAELSRRLIEEAGYPRNKIMMLLKQDHDARMAGKIAIPASDYKNMLGMLRSVERHHTAGGLLKGAATEQSFYWRDDEGVLRKCRTDAISANGIVIPDLKTTEDVSKSGFGRTIYQRRYHVQGAWYMDILRGLYGDDAPDVFAFVAAQKSRPHDVAVHYLTPEQIELGRRTYQRDLARLLWCEANDIWPGADGGQVIKAELPHYAYRDFDEVA